MTDPILTKPNDGSEIAKNENDRMVVAPEYQRFFNDLEEENNKNVDSVKHPTYLINQTPSALPDASERTGSMISVTGFTSPTFNAMAFSSTTKPGGNPPLPINTVTNFGGIAQFNTPIDFIDLQREIIIFNYVTNPTYNGTFKVTDSGTGFFRISSIAFTGPEAGGEFIFGSDWRLVSSNTIVV